MRDYRAPHLTWVARRVGTFLVELADIPFETVARAFQLLKGLSVELGQPGVQSQVESFEMKKLLVAQRRQQQTGGNQNAPLHFGLVLGFAWAGGNDDGAIMVGHF